MDHLYACSPTPFGPVAKDINELKKLVKNNFGSFVLYYGFLGSVS